MRSSYLPASANPRDRWMVSYLDVVTILLVFFLIAAARSLQTPPVRAVAPVQPHASPGVVSEPARPEPERPEPARPATEPRTNLIRARNLLGEQGLDSQLESRGLVISIPQAILFPSGTDSVSPEALPAIERIADVLRAMPDNNVRLIGYADTVPIRNRRFGSNWALSMARSQKILELLSGRYGIPEPRLSIASYGPYHPAASNDTPDGRAANRRVEIVILDESHPEDPQAE